MQQVRLPDFGTKWSGYRLKGEASQAVVLADISEPGNVKAEVETARQRIAKAAGVSPAAVRITVDFGA